MSSAPLPSASPATGRRWISQLQRARSEAQLLAVCRRFLASIRHSDLARLPLACRPIPIEDAGDLSAYALQLVRFHCEVDDPPPLVLRMAAFFAHANVRMAQILRQMNDAAEADSILAHLGRQPQDAGPQSPPSSGRSEPSASSDPQ